MPSESWCAKKWPAAAAEIDANAEFPTDLAALFAQNDLLGIPIPTEYGGLGGTFTTYVKVVEEICEGVRVFRAVRCRARVERASRFSSPAAKNRRKNICRSSPRANGSAHMR